MRLQIAFGFFYFSVLVVITSWSYQVSEFHWVKSDNDEVMCATSKPNKTLKAVISRLHCVSSCNHGCPSPPCQAVNYWKNRHIKSPLCVIVQSWLSISSLPGHQLLEEPSYQESTVCHRAITVVHLLPVRPSTTGRTHKSVNSSTTVLVLTPYKRDAKTTRWRRSSSRILQWNINLHGYVIFQ